MTIAHLICVQIQVENSDDIFWEMPVTITSATRGLSERLIIDRPEIADQIDRATQIIEHRQESFTVPTFGASAEHPIVIDLTTASAPEGKKDYRRVAPEGSESSRGNVIAAF